MLVVLAILVLVLGCTLVLAFILLVVWLRRVVALGLLCSRLASLSDVDPSRAELASALAGVVAGSCRLLARTPGLDDQLAVLGGGALKSGNCMTRDSGQGMTGSNQHKTLILGTEPGAVKKSAASSLAVIHGHDIDADCFQARRCSL